MKVHMSAHESSHECTWEHMQLNVRGQVNRLKAGRKVMTV